MMLKLVLPARGCSRMFDMLFGCLVLVLALYMNGSMGNVRYECHSLVLSSQKQGGW
jgi:hypothetical protein